MSNWKLAISLAAALAWAAPAAAQSKDTLSVDLPGDAATLDPHVQWDTDSYTIYRNIFDNLLTRDAAGKIVPQIGAAWRYVSDTWIEWRRFHGRSRGESTTRSTQRRPRHRVKPHTD